MKRPKYHHVGVRAGRVMRLVTLPTQAAQRDRRALVRVPRLCASSRPFVNPYQSLQVAPRRTSFRPSPECENTARRLTLMGPDWMRMGRVVIAPGVEEGDIVVFVVGGERVDAEVCNPNGGVVQKGTSGRATCFLYEAPQTPPDMHPNGSRAPASGKPFLQCPRMEGAGAARWGARLTRPIAVFPLFRTLSGLPTSGLSCPSPPHKVLCRVLACRLGCPRARIKPEYTTYFRQKISLNPPHPDMRLLRASKCLRFGARLFPHVPFASNPTIFSTIGAGTVIFD